jgi:hypothetical protein
VRSDVLGNVVALRGEVAELKKQLLEAGTLPALQEPIKNRVKLELDAMELPVRSR